VCLFLVYCLSRLWCDTDRFLLQWIWCLVWQLDQSAMTARLVGLRYTKQPPSYSTYVYRCCNNLNTFTIPSIWRRKPHNARFSANDMTARYSISRTIAVSVLVSLAAGCECNVISVEEYSEFRNRTVLNIESKYSSYLYHTTQSIFQLCLHHRRKVELHWTVQKGWLSRQIISHD